MRSDVHSQIGILTALFGVVGIVLVVAVGQSRVIRITDGHTAGTTDGRAGEHRGRECVPSARS